MEQLAAALASTKEDADVRSVLLAVVAKHEARISSLERRESELADELKLEKSRRLICESCANVGLPGRRYHPPFCHQCGTGSCKVRRDER